uniref:Integrase, catalytic region, zinc finger, CCHC-type, peptidase aspartic, catalytic n=1 Tax=Tanacetum cinerariifolium TaxID=118510 RepID=A0A6L2JM31_TANCI|nr:integrase, catalytic region, zinc finger, CCHC-type, peptidase aspartic, catalytic [Tanacetum cinerariifolium]
MNTLDEFMIVAGAENRLPMLDKTMYNSWESRMFLYIKGKKNGIMMLESIENGPLVYPTIEVDGQIRKKKYAELIEQEQLQDDCDVQAKNIVLQGLPLDVYALVNYCQSTKDIWERVKLLMKDTELSYQELKCKLYNEFDKFTSVKGETLHEYYFCFAQLINDMHIIGMTMQQVQLSSTPQTTHSSQPYSLTYEAPHHPQQHQHAYQPQINQPTPSVPQNAYHSPLISQQPPVEFPQIDSGLAVLVFLVGDDPIACRNKAMTFIQGQRFASLGTKGNATSSGGNNVAGQTTVVKCSNWQGEGNMTRQCTKPKRPRNFAWFKENMLMVQAQELGQVLDEEQLAFLADPGILDAKAVLMANLLSYNSKVLYEEKVNQETITVNEPLTAELKRYKERIKTFEQRFNVNLSSQEEMIDLQMDDMIRDRCALKHVIDSLKQTLSKQIKEKESLLQIVTVFKKESKEKENKNIDKEADLEKKIKELDSIVYKVGQSAQTVHMLTKPQVFYDDTHKQALGYQYLFYLKKAQRIKPTLYDDFENGLHSELNEVKLVFNQMESVVDECSVDKKYFNIQKKEVSLDNDRILDHIICQDVMNIIMHVNFVLANVLHTDNKYRVNDNLSIERLEQENDHLFELLLSQDIVHICVNFLLHAMIVVKCNKEVLVYVRDICPSSTQLSKKLVAITPLNKKRKLGMKSSTSASRSQPSGNTKNNRIFRGYGDYQMGKVTISQVYYVEGLGHNLFSVGQFCDTDLEAEVVATACFTKNRSLIRKRHNKTPYELIHNKKLDLSYFYVFGALCYPSNDSVDLDKLKPKADIGIFVGYAPAKNASGPGPQLLTLGTLSSGLVPNPPLPTSVASLVSAVASLVLAVAAPVPADSTSSPSLTLVDLDTSSLSTSQNPQESQSPVASPSVVEEFHDIKVAHLDNDPFFGVPIP